MSEGTRISWMWLRNLTFMQTAEPSAIFPRSSIFLFVAKNERLGINSS
jgi:hypothetical protein